MNSELIIGMVFLLIGISSLLFSLYKKVDENSNRIDKIEKYLKDKEI